MRKQAFFWIVAILTYGAYYFVFGSLSVEGYETAPIAFIILDVGTGFLSVLFFALPCCCHFSLEEQDVH